MKNIFYSALLLAFIFQSCKKKDDAVAAPVACFTTDVSESTDSTHSFLFDQCPPLYDLSYWDFGDGQYSSNPNPAHVFNHYGSFNVKLTVTNSTGQTNSVIHTILVGHYTLDKVIYTKASTYLVSSFYINLSVVYIPPSPPYWGVSDSVWNPASLPITHIIPDNPGFDLLDNPVHYLYEETDSVTYLDTVININPSTIINKHSDIVIDFTPYDTAKFTLYYKIVPR
jgi:PKD repeat protein